MKKRKNSVEAKVFWFDEQHSCSAPGKSTAEEWFAKFKSSEISIEDDARKDALKRLLRTKTSKSPQNNFG